MAKFHITKKGEPGPCRATKGSCPLGGEGDHYPTREAAQEAFEKKMTEGGGGLSGVKKTGSGPSGGSGGGKTPPAPANAAPAYSLQEAEAVLQETMSAPGVISSRGVAKLSPAEWGAVAESFAQEEERYAQAMAADTRPADLARKEGLLERRREYEEVEDKWLALASMEGKKPAGYQEDLRAAQEALEGPRARYTEAENALLRDPAFDKARWEFQGLLNKRDQYARLKELSLLAQHLATPRQFQGQEVPSGYDTFPAYYDLEGKPLIPESPTARGRTTTVTNSKGEKLAFHPSFHADLGERERENRAMGVTRGTVIAPAVATIQKQDDSTLTTYPKYYNMDTFEEASYALAAERAKEKWSDAVARNPESQAVVYYSLYDHAGARAAEAGPSFPVVRTRVDVKSVRGFQKEALATADNGLQR